MHSKWRYKIYIYSVDLGERESSKLQGLQYYFPENFRCNLTYYISENFPDSPLHHIFESENFRFPFFYEKEPSLGRKMWKIKL